jgi:N-acetylglutamate synthase/N-acetylornithine aminotransferase
MFTPLLSSLNQAGGGVGFGNQQINNQLQGEEMLARAFAKGAAMIPPNMLTLKEFHAANDRYISLKEQ